MASSNMFAIASMSAVASAHEFLEWPVYGTDKCQEYGDFCLDCHAGPYVGMSLHGCYHLNGGCKGACEGHLTDQMLKDYAAKTHTIQFGDGTTISGGWDNGPTGELIVAAGHPNAARNKDKDLVGQKNANCGKRCEVVRFQKYGSTTEWVYAVMMAIDNATTWSPHTSPEMDVEGYGEVISRRVVPAVTSLTGSGLDQNLLRAAGEPLDQATWDAAVKENEELLKLGKEAFDLPSNSTDAGRRMVDVPNPNREALYNDRLWMQVYSQDFPCDKDDASTYVLEDIQSSSGRRLKDAWIDLYV